ncbi:unnamed protein product, partial [Symbiodinium sp. KB8]
GSILDLEETLKAAGLKDGDSVQAISVAPLPFDTDLSSFYRYVHLEDMAGHGTFTHVRRLEEAVRLKLWNTPCGQEIHVAVKSMRRADVEQNLGRITNDREVHFAADRQEQRGFSDALTEIGVLSYLRQQPDLPICLPRMLGSFHDGEEVCLVREFFPDGDLFGQVQSGRFEGNEASVRHVMWQLLQAVCYLHGHNIGHRDISLENLLVAIEPGGTSRIQLKDFDQAVRIRSKCFERTIFRYFRPAGKPYYRPPESYVSTANQTVYVRVATDITAGDIVFAEHLTEQGATTGYRNEVQLLADTSAGQMGLALPAGYEVPPVDVFAIGVVGFITSWSVPPWQQALPTDRTFTWLQQHGLVNLLTAWHKAPFSPEAMRLLSGMIAENPRERWTVEQCLASEWFSPPARIPVPIHQSAM